MGEHSAIGYQRAIQAAIHAGDVSDVPGLLLLMALDGFGHEAEVLRRQMLTALSVVNGTNAEPTDSEVDR